MQTRLSYRPLYEQQQQQQSPSSPSNSTYQLHRRNSFSFSLYFKRIFSWPQLDFELAIWQMAYLLIAPSRVHRNIYYQKQTKNQWSRDDPAFVLLLCACQSICAIAYSIAFSKFTIVGILKTLLYMVLVEFLLTGIVIATIAWWIVNTWFISTGIHSSEQKVEWAYCFDVHCNGFVPFSLLTYVIMFFFLPIVLKEGVSALLVSNILYLLAITGYWYIVFLGFSALPFVKQAQYFLSPIAFFGFIILLSTLGNVNLSRWILNKYMS